MLNIPSKKKRRKHTPQKTPTNLDLFFRWFFTDWTPQYGNGKSTVWRCISYWKWGIFHCHLSFLRIVLMINHHHIHHHLREYVFTFFQSIIKKQIQATKAAFTRYPVRLEERFGEGWCFIPLNQKRFRAPESSKSQGRLGGLNQDLADFSCIPRWSISTCCLWAVDPGNICCISGKENGTADFREI